MRIRNDSGGPLTISDIPGEQTGQGLSFSSTQEVVLFNEDIERSTQLRELIDSNVVTILDDLEEPSTGTSVQDPSQATAEEALAGSKGLQMSDGVVSVDANSKPTIAGKVLTSTGADAASWQSVPPAPTLAHDLAGTEHNPDTLANLNLKISDANLIDTVDPRLSDARTPSPHSLAGTEHNPATFAQLNTKISDATLVEGTDFRLTNARTPVAHGLAGSEHNPSTLAQLNAKISDAIIDDSLSSRPAQVHPLGGPIHSADTLVNLNAKISDATLIADTDSRLTDARTPTPHSIAGSEHLASTLANLNSKISDATLVDTVDPRFSDDRTGSGLRSVTTVVSVNLAVAPTTGQVLTATSASSADWQTPVAGGGGGAWEVVATVEKTIDAPPHFQLPAITGLDLDTDKIWKFIVYFNPRSISTSNVGLYLNNDKVSANYKGNQTFNFSSFPLSSPQIGAGTSAGNGGQYIEGTITRIAGTGIVYVTSHSVSGNFASGLQDFRSIYTWTTTTSNITQIQIEDTSQQTNFEVGTKLTLLRLA